ncbi:putative RiPP precursor [Mesorhizobium sp. CU2]|nr:putative RiPP precursor [Mesorhizobium sp. CU3]TPO19891.1 putative RiPP precursor [Mesorhizobium sp. CU2]
MKKTYKRPILLKRQRLGSVVALVSGPLGL